MIEPLTQTEINHLDHAVLKASIRRRIAIVVATEDLRRLLDMARGQAMALAYPWPAAPELKASPAPTRAMARAGKIGPHTTTGRKAG